MLNSLQEHFPWVRFPLLALTTSHSREALRQFQSSRLRQLVGHAWDKVPFYRKRLQDCGLCPGDIRGLQDLHLLPLVHKQDLRNSEPEQLLARGRRPGQLLAHRSSGTTGTPLTLYRSWHEERMLGLLRMRALSLAGVRWFHRRAAVRPIHLNRHPNRVLELLNRLHIWPLQLFDCFLPPQQLLEQLLEYQPHLLTGYPGVLAALARYVTRTGITGLSPLVISCGGEVVTPLAREQIQAAFPSAYCRETYGCMEFNLIAAQCPQSRLLHTCDEGVIVEVVDNQGRSVQPGQTGSLVGTALHSFCLPLIRYQLSDLVVKGPARCECGSPAATIQEVQGRSLDAFVLSNGKVFRPSVIGDELISYGWLQQFQLVQEAADTVAVKLVVTPGAEAPELVRLRAVLQALSGPEVSLELQLVPEIGPEPSGKFRPYKPFS